MMCFQKTQDACQHCLVLDHSRTPSCRTSNSSNRSTTGRHPRTRWKHNTCVQGIFSCTTCLHWLHWPTLKSLDNWATDSSHYEFWLRISGKHMSVKSYPAMHLHTGQAYPCTRRIGLSPSSCWWHSRAVQISLSAWSNHSYLWRAH